MSLAKGRKKAPSCGACSGSARDVAGMSEPARGLRRLHGLGWLNRLLSRLCWLNRLDRCRPLSLITVIRLFRPLFASVGIDIASGAVIVEISVIRCGPFMRSDVSAVLFRITANVNLGKS